MRKRVPAALRKYGRLRTITQAPDGDLLITTSNGGGNDVILRVTPWRTLTPSSRGTHPQR